MPSLRARHLGSNDLSKDCGVEFITVNNTIKNIFFCKWTGTYCDAQKSALKRHRNLIQEGTKADTKRGISRLMIGCDMSRLVSFFVSSLIILCRRAFLPDHRDHTGFSVT